VLHRSSVLQCVAVQFVAVCCGEMAILSIKQNITGEVKRAEVCCIVSQGFMYSKLQCIAVCCSVL